MNQAGFHQQKRTSPTSFAIVLAIHAAALGALILAKGPPLGPEITRLKVRWIEAPPVPDPIPDPPPRHDTRQTERQVLDRPLPEVPVPPLNPTEDPPFDPPGLPSSGGGAAAGADPPANPPVPVRRDAQVDPRFASALQPPYPTSEQRAQRGGTVRIQVTIGIDGRVRAVARLAATSDAFWSVAERQALTRWRFRPATVDGRPVESVKVMTLHFRIEDV